MTPLLGDLMTPGSPDPLGFWGLHVEQKAPETTFHSGKGCSFNSASAFSYGYFS